jgi:hypothetical protein
MAFLPPIKRSLRKLLHAPAAPVVTAFGDLLQLELARELARLQSELRPTMPGNPAGHGFKVYSQADEDGIIEHICARLGIGPGVFAEIGCGDGRENNTHYLLLKGWRGAWVDGSAANIEAIRGALPPSLRLRLLEAFITRENVAALLRPALDALGPLDLLSVDVDGNDLPIAQAAVAAFRPRVVIAEYNAKFPYPMNVAVSYDPQRCWQGDDYHGASLAAWIEGLGPDYGLVCCNLAGTNAFFVRRQDLQLFGGYPPERLYQPARFHLTLLQSGHPPTLSFLADALKAGEAHGHPGGVA